MDEEVGTKVKGSLVGGPRGTGREGEKGGLQPCRRGEEVVSPVIENEVR